VSATLSNTLKLQRLPLRHIISDDIKRVTNGITNAAVLSRAAVVFKVVEIMQTKVIVVTVRTKVIVLTV
jgi:hypothetical protein